MRTVLVACDRCGKRYRHPTGLIKLASVGGGLLRFNTLTDVRTLDLCGECMSLVQDLVKPTSGVTP